MPEIPRSTAGARRATVLHRAVPVFARHGYHATPVTEVAEAAGISQAYVFRLFKGKLELFVAVLDHCYELVLRTLRTSGESASGASPQEVLDAMGDAYADLISDRDLLMLQIHAQSASDIPEVREAIRRGYAAVVSLARELSGGTEEQVQQFIAMGQLCHLIVSAQLDGVEAAWARTLTRGIRHPTAPKQPPPD